ncbi:hypothetical protein THAOC_03884 [Thalassiosira oceanica]|uniref:Uncharacterized protein n=1 Tax=Thalassiosira oceanica TaxID=159749 RepID=K0TPG0_THAOC|nr:hypothetical protein THAOC_03884 [Thalassiosira oceanica]|eukprot:EJK74437.1 hypothetical protein THAOC_03884 [Thalassiosira oceanica]
MPRPSPPRERAGVAGPARRKPPPHGRDRVRPADDGPVHDGAGPRVPAVGRGIAQEEAADERGPAPAHRREEQGQRGESSLERADGKAAASPRAGLPVPA